MTAEKLLNDLRVLYRRHPSENAPGEFIRIADAYRAALALRDIHERQRENVYEQTLFGGIPLGAAIFAARRRENARTVVIDRDGLRVETVPAWGDDRLNIEVYDATTGELLQRRERYPAEHAEQIATDAFVYVWHALQAGSEQECDGCYVQPDGTHDDGTLCLCAAGLTANPKACHCQPSPNEWHGPAYIRAEIAAEEV